VQLAQVLELPDLIQLLADLLLLEPWQDLLLQLQADPLDLPLLLLTLLALMELLADVVVQLTLLTLQALQEKRQVIATLALTLVI
jgi:hypothetical protein